MAKIHIDTTVSVENHEFVKKHKLKWSRLMENAISITKRLYDEGNDPDLVKSYELKVERLQGSLNKFVNFINAHSLQDKYADFDTNTIIKEVNI